jgi:hypothetical protein
MGYHSSHAVPKHNDVFGCWVKILRIEYAEGPPKAFSQPKMAFSGVATRRIWVDFSHPLWMGAIPKERTREKAQECDNACLPPINTHSEI